MTAEVAVMNRMGVALAADSAVTIGGQGKIYSSAEKLFQPSSVAPVGVMIYGQANFMGVPWETLIKAYRGELAKRKFDWLDDYAKHFLKFLRTNRQIFASCDESTEVMYLVVTYYHHIRDGVKFVIEELAKQNSGISEGEVAATVRIAVREELKSLRTHKYIVGFGPKFRERVRKTYGTLVREARKNVFGELPMSSATKRLLTLIGIELLCRSRFSSRHSGVVFAGFGEKQYMPALKGLGLQGAILGRPRVWTYLEAVTSDNSDATVIPFAQGEMVHRFMSGIDPNLKQYMQSSVDTVFKGVVDVMATHVAEQTGENKATLLEQLKKPFSQLVSSLHKDWESHGSDNYWGPIINIVASLPKDELAAMAESLVSLTKFKRRVSPEEESVGGPVDVAVITKGDGIIWIKRKHYFKPELNPWKMADYARRED